MLIHALMSGNIEIGNGYGVPGGGAYYGAQKPNIDTPSKSKELPDYLKQKLKARGILKDDTEKGSPVSTNYASLTYDLDLLYSFRSDLDLHFSTLKHGAFYAISS